MEVTNTKLSEVDCGRCVLSIKKHAERYAVLCYDKVQSLDVPIAEETCPVRAEGIVNFLSNYPDITLNLVYLYQTQFIELARLRRKERRNAVDKKDA
jgi:hypothetical protein